jgi:hypothetical protein
VSAARAAFKIGSEWRKLDASARGKLINKVLTGKSEIPVLN